MLQSKRQDVLQASLDQLRSVQQQAQLGDEERERERERERAKQRAEAEQDALSLSLNARDIHWQSRASTSDPFPASTSQQPSPRNANASGEDTLRYYERLLEEERAALHEASDAQGSSALPHSSSSFADSSSPQQPQLSLLARQPAAYMPSSDNVSTPHMQLQVRESHPFKVGAQAVENTLFGGVGPSLMPQQLQQAPLWHEHRLVQQVGQHNLSEAGDGGQDGGALSVSWPSLQSMIQDKSTYV
jgi:hypothetical protein